MLIKKVARTFCKAKGSPKVSAEPFWAVFTVSNFALYLTLCLVERLAERAWSTKFQFSLLNFYFRLSASLSGFQSSFLLMIQIRNGPNTCSHYDMYAPLSAPVTEWIAPKSALLCVNKRE